MHEITLNLTPVIEYYSEPRHLVGLYLAICWIIGIIVNLRGGRLLIVFNSSKDTYDFVHWGWDILMSPVSLTFVLSIVCLTLIAGCTVLLGAGYVLYFIYLFLTWSFL